MATVQKQRSEEQNKPGLSSSDSSGTPHSSSGKSRQSDKENQATTVRTPFKQKQYPNNQPKKASTNEDSVDTPKKSYKYSEEVSMSTKCIPQSGKIISSSRVIQTERPTAEQRQVDFGTISQIYSQHEISHVIDYNGEFEGVKRAFTEVSQKRKLHVMRETNNILIVKKEPSYSYKCIFSLCMPFSEQGAVYQLKNYPTRRSKAKIILISGDFQVFEKFRKDFCCQLWQNKHILANQADAIELFFHMNRTNFDFILHQCNSILVKKKKQNHQHANSLLKVLKDSEANLKRRMAKFEGINHNPSAQKKLQQLIYGVVKMTNVYERVYFEQNEQLEDKKKQLISNYTLNSLFNHLQVEPQYRLIAQTSQLSLSMATQRQRLPYFSAIQLLQSIQLGNVPSSNMQLASVFSHRLRSSCNEGNRMVKLVQLDMDSLLPLTIYCALLAQNKQLLPVCKMMLEYMDQQDNCESEKKIFTSIEASLEFIRQQWTQYPKKKESNQQDNKL